MTGATWHVGLLSSEDTGSIETLDFFSPGLLWINF